MKYDRFSIQAVVYLAAVVIAVPSASRMGLGSVLGYLAAGIIIGPVMGLVGPETAELEQEMESEMLNLRFGNQDEGTAEDKEAEG
jgi:CPA2 family monovalent cation:H+ antiporter-2